MDMQTMGLIAGGIAVLAFVFYIWDRYSKEQPVDWMDAGKLAVSAGGVAGGIAYAVGTDGAADAVETVTAAAQEMFVGKPAF
jgi:hypothetical protein